MTDEATTVAAPVDEADFDVFLSSRDEAHAYPHFYGQLVKFEYSPPDADGKRRTHAVFKPYAYFIEGEVVPADDIKTSDGCLHARGFFAPGDMQKKYTYIFKMSAGLKAQRVNVAERGMKGAVGHEGWYREEPGRFSNIFPQQAPKNAPVIGRPDDWDFEAWQKEHGSESAFNSDGANPAIGGTPSADAQVLPETQWDTIAGLVEGKSQVTALRAITGNAEFGGTEARAIQATLDAMMASGFLNKAGGNYHRAAAV